MALYLAYTVLAQVQVVDGSGVIATSLQGELLAMTELAQCTLAE